MNARYYPRGTKYLCWTNIQKVTALWGRRQASVKTKFQAIKVQWTPPSADLPDVQLSGRNSSSGQNPDVQLPNQDSSSIPETDIQFPARNTSSFPERPALNRSMHSFIQFITTPTADTQGTVLLLHFNQGRYIIGNLHEGFTRALQETRIKVHSVANVFLTGTPRWKNLGGLMGMLLRLGDVKKEAAIKESVLGPKRPDFTASKHEEGTVPIYNATDGKQILTLHGGPNLTHTLATARRFIFRKDMPVRVKEYEAKAGGDRKPDWVDDCVKVWALFIEPSRNEMTTTSTASRSAQKRSFDDFIGESPNSNSTDAHHKLREQIVSEMFDSSWRHEDLEECLLADVKMPATIFIRDEHTNKVQWYRGPTPDKNLPIPHMKVLVRKPWPAVLAGDLPPTKPSHSALSYIFQSKQQRGKLLIDRLLELKVPKGPEWGKLTDGFDVQSLDGKTIKPEMVVEKSEPMGGVVVADLPSQEYVRGFLDRPELENAEVMSGVQLFIWNLGPGVSQNEELQTFINDRQHFEHIISSPDHCPDTLYFHSSACASVRLNHVDPPRHPIPISDHFTVSQNGKNAWVNKLICAKPLLRVQLRPTLALKEEFIRPPLDPDKVLEEILPHALDLAHKARLEISSQSVQTELAVQDLPSPEAEIICLGTGSTMPSKYRNVLSTLLRVPGQGSYLFDCGENTLGQLRRLYTPAELGVVLRDLKFIWISHIHADHHLGITSVIRAWYEEVHGHEIATGQISANSQGQETSMDLAQILRSEKRLCIISHEYMLEWLKEYASVEDYGFDRLVPVLSSPVSFRRQRSKLEWNNNPILLQNNDDELAQAFKSATGVADINTCAVAHCFGSQGVSITFPDGFKFTFSGDCLPSASLVRIGRFSTVLLHEATFEDDFLFDATAKKHSTTSQAIAVAKAMGARRLLLTHFSQRYSKIPVMDKMDEMRVKLEEDYPSDILAEDTNQSNLPAQGITTDIAGAETTSLDETASDPPETRISTRSPTELTYIAPSFFKTQFPDNPPSKDFKFGVAFDYMRVKVADIMLLEKLTPVMLQIFEKPEIDRVDGPDNKFKRSFKNKAQRSPNNQIEPSLNNQTKSSPTIKPNSHRRKFPGPDQRNQV